MGSGAKSYMRKASSYMRKCTNFWPYIYEEAISHTWLCTRSFLNFPIYEENFILFFISSVFTWFCSCWLVSTTLHSAHFSYWFRCPARIQSKSNKASWPLKVPSGQIRSAWEWYHWKSLEKDINRYMFFIFYFWSWIFYKSSKFWAAPCKNEPTSCLFGSRFV